MSCLLLFSLLLIACGPNESVQPSDQSIQEPLPMQGEITIEGKIAQIMESYPLQLVVETATGRYHVGLKEETQILQDGSVTDTNALSRAPKVSITGTRTGDNAMSADTIEIVNE